MGGLPGSVPPGLCHLKLHPPPTPRISAFFLLLHLLPVRFSGSNIGSLPPFPPALPIFVLPFRSVPCLATGSLRPPGTVLDLPDLCQTFHLSPWGYSLCPVLPQAPANFWLILITQYSPQHRLHRLSNNRKMSCILKHPLPPQGELILKCIECQE